MDPLEALLDRASIIETEHFYLNNERIWKDLGKDLESNLTSKSVTCLWTHIREKLRLLEWCFLKF